VDTSVGGRTLDYDALKAPFDDTYTLSKGGADLTYITAEQVVTRLNEVLGSEAWSFRILDRGLVGDDHWVLGQLTVHLPGGRDVVREQYGEATTNRGMPIGDALKSAASSALKKCASLIGVGLYLSRKEEQPSKGTTEERIVARAAQIPRQRDTDGNVVGGTPITCEACGEEMRDTTRDNGTVWTATEKADFSRKKFHGRVLCYGCSRNAG
jgi:hypothetical protein